MNPIEIRKNQPEWMTDLEHVFSVLRHELGNSVNSLKITLEVLFQNFDAFDEARKLEFLKRSLEQVSRQHRILDAMKAYSKAAAGEMEEISVFEFWKDCIDPLEEKILRHRIRFIRNPPGEGCRILANRLALGQIFEHLVENAIDAVCGAAHPVIEITTFRLDAFLNVIVGDNGSGIENGVMRKIFTPLFTTRPGHSGLGLSIARKILTQMGGRIEVTNRPERGAEVRVWIPAQSRDTATRRRADAPKEDRP